MATALRSNVLALAGWIVACFLAAATGAAWPPGEWYASLAKPAWNPPAWVFGPVWTTLYLAMAVAVWRVGRPGWSGQRRAALACFLLQLALNAAWTPVFFGLHAPGIALVVIVALFLAIAATIASFAQHDRLAALLLAPYLAWVGFATVLNAELWRLNRS